MYSFEQLLRELENVLANTIALVLQNGIMGEWYSGLVVQWFTLLTFDP